MTTTKMLMAATVLLSLAACQSPTAQSTGGAATPAELNFVTNAYQIIRFDREEGDLAKVQAQDPRVRDLAGRLVTEANQFASELDPVAASAGITPPNVLPNDLRVRLGHMRLDQGMDFDRTYLANQIASHEQALHDMEAMQADPGPRFSDLAKKGEVLLRTNLQALRVLQGALKKPAS